MRDSVESLPWRQAFSLIGTSVSMVARFSRMASKATYTVITFVMLAGSTRWSGNCSASTRPLS